MHVIRWIGRVFLAVIALGAFAMAAIYARTEWLSRHRVPLPAQRELRVSTDSATIAKGAHLVDAVAGCIHCHAADLGGGVLVDEPLVLRLAAPNLTMGRGGSLSRYDDVALEAAIRHGVAPDGRVLRFMPSHEYATLADDQLAAIIAYLRAQPPVDRSIPPVRVGPIGRVLAVAGKLSLFPYYRIDHTQEARAVAPVGPTVEHGAYLVATCSGCHGPTLAGGPIAGAPPDWPASSNLTPTGIGSWSEEDFIRTLRTGVNPSGRALNDAMPWKQFGQMTDDELLALRRYLATVAPRQSGSK